MTRDASKQAEATAATRDANARSFRRFTKGTRVCAEWPFRDPVYGVVVKCDSIPDCNVVEVRLDDGTTMRVDAGRLRRLR